MSCGWPSNCKVMLAYAVDADRDAPNAGFSTSIEAESDLAEREGRRFFVCAGTSSPTSGCNTTGGPTCGQSGDSNARDSTWIT